MSIKNYRTWFSIVSIILILFGILYCFFGLKIFTQAGIIPQDKDLLIDWESALYGAIMLGWGLTLFLLGRLAFERLDVALLKILLYGIALWLFVEAAFSLYLGVYFNVGVDIAVTALFGYPIIKTIGKIKKNY